MLRSHTDCGGSGLMAGLSGVGCVILIHNIDP
jgi:hypothetical protein